MLKYADVSFTTRRRYFEIQLSSPWEDDGGRAAMVRFESRTKKGLIQRWLSRLLRVCPSEACDVQLCLAVNMLGPIRSLLLRMHCAYEEVDHGNGIWFRDLDGYCWFVYLQNPESPSKRSFENVRPTQIARREGIAVRLPSPESRLTDPLDALSSATGHWPEPMRLQVPTPMREELQGDIDPEMLRDLTAGGRVKPIIHPLATDTSCQGDIPRGVGSRDRDIGEPEHVTPEDLKMNTPAPPGRDVLTDDFKLPPASCGYDELVDRVLAEMNSREEGSSSETTKDPNPFPRWMAERVVERAIAEKMVPDTRPARRQEEGRKDSNGTRHEFRFGTGMRNFCWVDL